MSFNVTVNGKEYKYKNRYGVEDSPYYEKPVVKRIECVCCESLFKSVGKYNRMCGNCKRTEGDYGYYKRVVRQAKSIK